MIKLFFWVTFFHVLLFAFFPHRSPKLPPKKKIQLSFQTLPDKMISQTKPLIASAPTSHPEDKISSDLPLVKDIKFSEPKATKESPLENISSIKESPPKHVLSAPKTDARVKASTPIKPAPKSSPKPKNKESTPLEKLTTIKNIPSPSIKPKQEEKNKELTKGEKTATKLSSSSQDPKLVARNKEIAKIRSQLDEAKKELSLDLPYAKNQKTIEFSSDTVEEESFLSILVLFLQEHLHMPYPDQIAVSLILSTQGKCLGVTISQCKNQENRTYLEKRLPQLSYPNFPHKKNQKSFSLLFEVD